MLLEFLAVLAIFFLLVYLWFKRSMRYWKEKNVPHPKPHVFLGNLKDSVLLKKNMFQIFTEIYNDFQEFPYIGFYKIRIPGIVLRDPKLIYDILTKDFYSFEENDIKVDEDVDPLAAKNPFFLTGQKWKISRSRLISCFSSGKMKLMLSLMVKVAEDMNHYIESKITPTGFATLETKELSAKFTTDNVASCGFGLEANSFSDTEAEFRRVGQMVFTPGFGQALRMMLLMTFPSLSKLLTSRFIPIECEIYFRRIVKQALQYREENKIVRNDFLDIVTRIREEDPNYTIDDITSHALSFFLDGFETSSIGLSFALYELAANPTIQEKLRREVDVTLAKHENALTYECIQDMAYLDCVIQEALRMHPPAGVLLKVCTKDYRFPAINGNKRELLVKAETPIALPVYGLHMDPQYYPNPEVFDPDRFSAENKSDIKKGTYLPFGDGPRICLGQRFAILQIKVAIAALIRVFEMRVNKKTKLPLEIDEKYFMLSAKGGLWIDYYKRK